jgi:mRNA-degrading endonuclease RelE of RelBE toxin-antitoxin system
MRRIDFTSEALDDLMSFRRFDQKRIVEGIETQLPHNPTVETRHRKRLRPNALAEWELRIGGFRVFYDVPLEEPIVKIIAIGHKEGNTLYLHGKRFEI